jgi:hypothetical protein
MPPSDNPYASPGARGGEPPILAQPVDESESVVRVDYHLTLEDLVDYNYFFQCNLPSVRRQWWIFRILGVAGLALGAACFLYGLAQPASELGMLGLPPAILSFFLLYITAPSRRKAGIRRLLTGMLREGRNENLFSLHRVWISPTGIRRISRYADTSYQWPVVEKIADSPQAAYIYDSTASAIVVPRSAFDSDAAFQHFVDTARQFWKQAAP